MRVKTIVLLNFILNEWNKAINGKLIVLFVNLGFFMVEQVIFYFIFIAGFICSSFAVRKKDLASYARARIKFRERKRVRVKGRVKVG